MRQGRGVMKQAFFIIVLLLMPFGVSAEEIRNTKTNSKAPVFSLQDQYDKTVSLGQFAGHTVILIASDKEGSLQNPAWRKAIKDKYADQVVIQGIANVSTVPFFLKGKIRNDFKKNGESILLDWKGEVFRSYDLKPKAANVVLIDGSGMIRFLHAGPADPDAQKRLIEKIDQLETP